MRGKVDPVLRAECVRLRLDEGLSLRQIHERTGAAQGSLSAWLRNHPLSADEVRKRQADAARHRAAFNKKPRGEESNFHRMVSDRDISKARKAKIAESAVLFRLALFGLDPFGSVFDGDKTDWLVEVPLTGKVVKVQVRWARSGKSGLPAIRLLCSNGRKASRRFKKGEFDFIVAYDLYTDTAYVWSWDEVAGNRNSVTISDSYAERWEKLLVP